MLYYLFILNVISNALQTSSQISTYTMSVATGLSSSETCRNPFQQRNDSGELDVFEAAQYFSCANENPASVYAAKYDHQYFIRNGTRMSLDMPKRISSITHDHSLEKQIKKENKKYKQPSSPAARLASFLNSLFNQKSRKKKKKPKSSGKINDLEDENTGGLRRKRSSSLEHFPVTNVASSGPDWRSSFSASNSGFTTPHAKPPTKSCKELIKSDYFRLCAVKNELHNEKRSANYAWIDERFSFRNGISEKTSRNGSTFEFSGHGRRFATTWGFHDSSSEGREIRKFSDPDDHGSESDSSSDLFDLPNYGSNFCSRTGLPVYETTKLDRIKRSSLIANAATVP